MQDLYSILGVSRKADSSEIKAAYRALAKQSHPDLNLGDSEAEGRTKEINHAYAILSDEDLRAAYDQELAYLSARRRRVMFVSASAFAAGMAIFAIGAALLAVPVLSPRSSPPLHQGKLLPPASSGQIETAVAKEPESAGASAVTPLADLPNETPEAKTGAPGASLPERAAVEAVAGRTRDAKREQRDIRPEHAASQNNGGKPAGRAVKPAETAGGVPPKPQRYSEAAAWMAFGKAMAQRLSRGEEVSLNIEGRMMPELDD